MKLKEFMDFFYPNYMDVVSFLTALTKLLL
jgi:hypothetical protein